MGLGAPQHRQTLISVRASRCPQDEQLGGVYEGAKRLAGVMLAVLSPPLACGLAGWDRPDGRPRPSPRPAT